MSFFLLQFQIRQREGHRPEIFLVYSKSLIQVFTEVKVSLAYVKCNTLPTRELQIQALIRSLDRV